MGLGFAEALPPPPPQFWLLFCAACQGTTSFWLSPGARQARGKGPPGILLPGPEHPLQAVPRNAPCWAVATGGWDLECSWRPEVSLGLGSPSARAHCVTLRMDPPGPDHAQYRTTSCAQPNCSGFTRVGVTPLGVINTSEVLVQSEDCGLPGGLLLARAFQTEQGGAQPSSEASPFSELAGACMVQAHCLGRGSNQQPTSLGLNGERRKEVPSRGWGKGGGYGQLGERVAAKPKQEAGYL